VVGGGIYRADSGLKGEMREKTEAMRGGNNGTAKREEGREGGRPVLVGVKIVEDVFGSVANVTQRSEQNSTRNTR
jgi:hypothetical protein